jgi:hypothetical protein
MNSGEGAENLFSVASAAMQLLKWRPVQDKHNEYVSTLVLL